MLMGSSNNNVELSGKAMDEKEVVFTPVLHVHFIIVKTIASSLFGRYELGAHLVIEKGDEQYLMMKGGIKYALIFYLTGVCVCMS